MLNLAARLLPDCLLCKEYAQVHHQSLGRELSVLEIGVGGQWSGSLGMRPLEFEECRSLVQVISPAMF